MQISLAWENCDNRELMQAVYTQLNTFTFYMNELGSNKAAEDRVDSSSSTAVYSRVLLAVQALHALFVLLQDMLRGKVSKTAVMTKFPFRAFAWGQLEQVCNTIYVEIAEVRVASHGKK